MDELGIINVDGADLPATDVFEYLSQSHPTATFIRKSSRALTAPDKWQSTTGVLCDKKIPDLLKSKIYCTAAPPNALCDVSMAFQCWPVTKEVDRRLEVMEMKMLRPNL